ncbi:hypothetical protein Hanom_Chr03g00211271 [Helianthus anomalus]
MCYVCLHIKDKYLIIILKTKHVYESVYIPFKLIKICKPNTRNTRVSEMKQTCLILCCMLLISTLLATANGSFADPPPDPGHDAPRTNSYDVPASPVASVEYVFESPPPTN